jgi:3-oxoacyl-[acyl-carrier-protein] synthase III
MDSSIYLSSLAAWHPEEVLTNEDLSAMVDTTDAWIVDRVGIRERRQAPSHMRVHQLGVRAAGLALAYTDAASLDLVLCAPSFADYHVPATANLIASETGCTAAAAFDIRVGCSAFVFALHTLRGLFATGGHRRALLVIPEALTHATDYSDRSTCILFGDAAFACIVTPDPPAGLSFRVADTLVGSRSRSWTAVQIPVGGTIAQDGPAVQAFAIKKMSEVVESLLCRNALTADRADYLVGHQANLGILTRVAERTGFTPPKHLTNIELFGNCGGASAPCVLAQNAHRFRHDERIVVATVGTGLSWGGALLLTHHSDGVSTYGLTSPT